MKECVISPLEGEMAGRQRGSVRPGLALPAPQGELALHVWRPPSVAFGDVSPSRGEITPS